MSQLHLGQSQQHVLAPQMRRSLEVLQASAAELSQLIQQEISVNPVLEEIREDISLETLEESAESERADDTRSWEIETRGTRDFDAEERRQRMWENTMSGRTLQQHLLEQLSEADESRVVKRAAEIVIGQLDDRGLFEGTLRDLALRTHRDFSQLEAGLKLVQSLEPAGIAAQSLTECLLLQLERNEQQHSLAYRLVKEFLPLLAKKQYALIRKACAVTDEEIERALVDIRALQLQPASGFEATHNPHVLPDVVIEKEQDGDWSAQLTSEHLPALRINDFYKDLLGKPEADAKARQFLREQIHAGRGLMRAIELRQETLLAIAYQMIAKQRAFLEHGERYLKPMTMKEVGDALSMHATTISRAVSGKYLATPWGMMDMRKFFASGYQTEEGGDVSSESVRQELQRLIEQENPRKPYSDEALVRELKARGIVVARRTIAKYREMLHVLPSHLRKQL